MQALIDTLSATIPHYIRCIKPNAQKRPTTVDEDLFTHQVAYHGIVENTKIKRAGFAYKTLYTDFLRRYSILSKITYPARDDVDPESQVRIVHVIISIAHSCISGCY